MAEIVGHDDILRFKRNSICTSLISSEELNLSPSSQRRLSEFPDVSIVISSSCDNSDDVELIKSKTSEISKALASKLSKLSEVFQPFSEDFRSSKCSNATPPPKASDLQVKLYGNPIMESSSRLREMKKNLMHSKKMLRNGAENINRIAEENAKLSERLEDIRCRLEASGAGEKEKNIGCKCSVF